MAYKTSSTAYGSTGSKTLTCGFQPTAARFFVGGVVGGDNVMHFSRGSADGTRQNCDWQFADGTFFTGDTTNSKIISHWENVGGTLTEVFSATFTAFTATGCTINVSIADASYNLDYELQS